MKVGDYYRSKVKSYLMCKITKINDKKIYVNYANVTTGRFQTSTFSWGKNNFLAKWQKFSGYNTPLWKALNG